MKPLIGLIPLLAVSFPLRADKLPVPANAPPAFRAECGGCHLAFPPALLTAADWRRVMSGLEQHYGDNAGLEQATRQQIEDFLVRHAGSGSRLRGSGEPPRITATQWFRKEHDEVRAETWNDSRVRSAANCTACHSSAEHGSFREEEIRLPGGTRRGHR